MRRLLILSLLICIAFQGMSFQKKSRRDYLLTISTNYGEMKAILFEDTPLHRENFLKLVEDGFYDSLLFHRVIEEFMIQGGDPKSRDAAPSARLGSGGPGYRIPAEILPNHFHKKGALAAARTGDRVNPDRESSGSQFYIVQGTVLEKEKLLYDESKIGEALQFCFNQLPESELTKTLKEVRDTRDNEAFANKVYELANEIQEQTGIDLASKSSQEMIQAYTTIGGTPRLDEQYTVFGQVIQGIEVIDKIAAVETQRGDRPVENVTMTISAKRMRKKKSPENTVMTTKIKTCLAAFMALLCFSCTEKEELVVIETPYGNMTAVLFEDTPVHKENFLTLAKSGKYDSVIFHRVIENFMIQTGDLSTGTQENDADYTLPAEFVPEKHIHNKGALAAARRGDTSNPQKESSGSQFYIVDGDLFNNEGLAERAKRRQYLKLYGYFDRMLRSKRYPELTEKYYYHVNQLEEDSTYDFYTAQENLIFQSLPVIEERFGPQPDPGYPNWAREIYATVGGAPHLDGEYTVFGQVIEGLEVIDKIAAVETNETDKPLNELRMQIKVIKMTKDEIEQTYNYKFPNLEK